MGNANIISPCPSNYAGLGEETWGGVFPRNHASDHIFAIDNQLENACDLSPTSDCCIYTISDGGNQFLNFIISFLQII